MRARIQGRNGIYCINGAKTPFVAFHSGIQILPYTIDMISKYDAENKEKTDCYRSLLEMFPFIKTTSVG